MTEVEIEQWKKSVTVSPYNRELGIRFSALSENGCVLCLSPRPDLSDDPQSGTLHVGAIDALVDTTFGCAVYARSGTERGFATLDLRIDHLRRSTAGRELFCVGNCHKVSAHLAFVRGCAYHDDPADPIATAVAIFMFADGFSPLFHLAKNA